MKRLDTMRLLLFALLLTTHLLGGASVKIGDLYYNIDNAQKTAEVTYQGRSSSSNSSYVSGDLVIPSSIESNGNTYWVASIGNSAFAGCSGLTSVAIPNSVTTIGDGAFSRCSGLTSITIPDSVTTIGDEAFNYCSGLTSVTIGDSVTTIGRYSFNKCSGLTSVTIPNSVTTIGDFAFYGCSELKSVTIPSSLASIGTKAFSQCSELTSIHITDIAAWCKIEFGNYESNPLTYAHSLYINGTEIKDLVIPDSVTEICDMAFYGCNELTSVTIPNSVKSIGQSAFNSCDGLKSVHIANSVKSIGPGVFRNCSGLTSVHITDIAAWCKIEFGNEYSNPLTYAHSLYINRKKVKDLAIPDSVTEIGDYTFYQCSGLTSVTIPNSVTAIGNSTFRACGSLASVTIPNAVKSIGESAFYGCSGLTSITIPDSVTTIGDYTFYGCSGIKSVTIPNSVKSIGDGAFVSCRGLTSVTIGNSVTSIGNSAFSNCINMTSVQITDLAAWCKIKFGNSYSNPLFYAHSLHLNGTEVKVLVIPDSVTSIGDYAFSECSSLKSVTIPSSLASIGNYAFSGCTNLSSVYSYAETPPVMYEDAFSEATYQAATLYVPKGCADAYKDDAVWYLFNTIVEGEHVSGVDDVIAAGTASGVTGYYNLQGERSAEPWSGMNIVVYGDGTRRKAVY